MLLAQLSKPLLLVESVSGTSYCAVNPSDEVE
jgi:hypothetical protein